MFEKIESNKLITEKESYDAMLYFLDNFRKLTGSNEITDILGPASYVLEKDTPLEIMFWVYWLEAIEQVRKFGPPPPDPLTLNPDFNPYI